MKVLVLGGTGHVGQLVLSQLLQNFTNIHVKAIVRSTDKLTPEVLENKKFIPIVGSITKMDVDELSSTLEDCDAVVSCLGHNLSFKGLFGPPYALVKDSMKLVHQSIDKISPKKPMKLILLNSVSVNQPDNTDNVRGSFEKCGLALLRFFLPPCNDNQKAADYLHFKIKKENKYIEWVALRPDGFIEGNISSYDVHQNLIVSLANAQVTTKANIAHFICDLINNQEKWNMWKYKMPVIVDTNQPTKCKKQ